MRKAMRNEHSRTAGHFDLHWTWLGWGDGVWEGWAAVVRPRMANHSLGLARFQLPNEPLSPNHGSEAVELCAKLCALNIPGHLVISICSGAQNCDTAGQPVFRTYAQLQSGEIDRSRLRYCRSTHFSNLCATAEW